MEKQDGNMEQRTREFSRRELLTKDSPRRGFLKGTVGTLGIATASTLGYSGQSAASDDVEKELRRAASKYDTKEKMQDAILTNAEAVLSAIEERGVASRRSILQLPATERYSSVEEYRSSKSGAIVFGVPDGDNAVAKIELKTQLPNGWTLLLRVIPSQGHSYGVIESNSGQLATIPRTGSDDVSTYDCDYETSGEKYCKIYCAPDSCGCLYEVRCDRTECHTHQELCTGCRDYGC